MLNNLSSYDYIFGSIILLSALIGLFRGGINELLALSTWVGAIFVMRNYAGVIDSFLPPSVQNGLLRSLLSYLIAFISVALMISLIKMILNNFITQIGLGGLNYILGLIFGLARGIIISALYIIVVEAINLDNTHGWQRSYLAPALTPTVKYIVEAVPARIKQFNLAYTAELDKEFNGF